MPKDEWTEIAETLAEVPIRPKDQYPRFIYFTLSRRGEQWKVKAAMKYRHCNPISTEGYGDTSDEACDAVREVVANWAIVNQTGVKYSTALRRLCNSAEACEA